MIFAKRCSPGTSVALCMSGMSASPVRMASSVAVPASGDGKACAMAISRCRAASGGNGPDASPTKRMPATCSMSCASACRIISASASGNNCAALSMILSNTGCASSTDAAMTLSTSLVAVCCSSASCVSRNRRAFWIAIAAWPAKDSTSAISRSVNRAHGRCAKVRAMKNAPTARSCTSIGATTTA